MTKEFIANAIKEGVTYSYQIGGVVIHGAIEMIIKEHEKELRNAFDYGYWISASNLYNDSHSKNEAYNKWKLELKK